MGTLVNNYKNPYYEKDDGSRIYFGINHKYATEELIESLIEGKPTTFERKSLFGYSKVSVSLKDNISKAGRAYQTVMEGDVVEEFDDRPIITAAENRIISDTFLTKDNYIKHIKAVLDSLSLIKEYNIHINILTIDENDISKSGAHINIIIYRNYKNRNGIYDKELQVYNKYFEYSNKGTLARECSSIEFSKSKSKYEELKTTNLRDQILDYKNNIILKSYLYLYSYRNECIKVLSDANIAFRTIFVETSEARITKTKDKCKYVSITIDNLVFLYAKYNEDGMLDSEISEDDYNKANKAFIDEYAEYQTNRNNINTFRANLYSQYETEGLEAVVKDITLDTALDMGYFTVFQTGLAKIQSEDKAIKVLCFDTYPSEENLDILKVDIMNILKIYYEFNNISQKNVASLAPFIIRHNLKKYYDDMLLYDEAIEPIIKQSKDKKLLKKALTKIAGTTRAATYVDRSSTFYFEKTVRAKNMVMNPVQLLNDLVSLIPEYNDRSDVVVLFNIVLNDDESFTYQFYTFAEDSSGGDMDGRRVGNMTRLYNQCHKNKIAFEYEF